MCDTCGCNVTDGNRRLVAPGGPIAAADGRAGVEVLHGLMAENDRAAAHNRRHFAEHGVLAVNLMSSPGAGKTRLLEATIDAVGGRRRIAVIEGDLETENDAARIRAKGVAAVQITTGTACHLDAHLVHGALHDLDLDGIDILFIENVGNLVCPAAFDLGQQANVALLSVTEGDDKPAKYPVMFRAADLVLITKTDLLAVMDDFSPAAASAHLRALASPAPVLEISAKRPYSLTGWLDWLEARRAAVLKAPAGQGHGPTPGPDRRPVRPPAHAHVAGP